MEQPELATCQFIVPHPKQPKFMVVKHSDGRWLPPQVRFPVDYTEGLRRAEVVESLLRNYGLQVVLLRRLQSSPDYHCVEVELRPSGITRKLDAVWVGQEDYDRYRGEQSESIDVFQRWLNERTEGKTAPLRRPWEMKGWIHHAERWIRRELELRGIQVNSSVRQVRALWREAAVLSVQTSAGKIYFKAGAPDAINEAKLTRALANAFPNRVAQPLAVHDQLPWMLNADLGVPNSLNIDLRTRQQLLYALADLQQKSGEKIEDWSALGVPNRGLGHLAKFLRDFEQQREFLETFIRFRDKQFLKLTAYTQRMSNLCRDLAQSPVPETLVHTDFRPGNTYGRDNRFYIADWARTTIGHPFLSLFTWLALVPGKGKAWPAYLDPFTRYAPMNELLDMLQSTFHLVHVNSICHSMELMRGLEPGEVIHEDLKRGMHKRIEAIINI